MPNLYKVTEKQFKYIIISIFIIAFIFVVNRPVFFAKDSQGYLNMVLPRSAGYPVFLHLIKSVFGSYFYLATIILQFILGAFSIYFFINSLKKILLLNKIWYIILTLVLLIPYVYNQQLANTLLSEALAYPLYLIIITYFITSIFKGETKYLATSIPLLIILILTRSQFLFLIPVAIIVFLYISSTNKKVTNKLLLVVLFLIPFTTLLLDKTYHKVVHNHFVSTPWTGIHIATPAFYVSDAEDYSIFSSEKEQLFFKEVYSKLYLSHLNINNLNGDSHASKDISTFIKDYTKIANSTIFPIGKSLSDEKLTENEKIIEVDKLTKSMTIPLILNNFKKWLTIYIKNFIYGFGNAKHLLLFVILLFYGLYKMTKTNSKHYKIVLLTILLIFSNIGLVSFGMRTIKRFTFYNDWVIFLIVFILFSLAKHSKKELL